MPAIAELGGRAPGPLGAAATTREAAVRAPRFTSLAGRLALLLLLLAGLPAIPYLQLERSVRAERTLLAQSFRTESALVALALAPLLDQPGGAPQESVNEQLARYRGGITSLRLLFRPRVAAAATGFYFVGAAPEVPVDRLSAELDELNGRHILGRADELCAGDPPTEGAAISFGAASEPQTALVPIRSAA